MRALSGWRRQLLSFLLGMATALGLAPIYFVPACFVAMSLLVVLLDGIHDDEKRTVCRKGWLFALTGWSFGLGYFVVGLWWVANALLIDPLRFAWIIPFAVVGLPAVLALYWGVATAFASILWRRGVARLLVLAFSFGLCEWLRGVLFTGFTWNSIGYTAMPTPLFMQSSAVVGLYGMNSLAVLCYSMPSLLFYKDKKWGGLLLAGLVIFCHLGFGVIRLNEAATVRHNDDQVPSIRLLQPSILQQEKYDQSTRAENFERHLALMAQPPKPYHKNPDIIVWPETSVPYILDYAPSVVQQISHSLSQGQIALLGSVRVDNAVGQSGRKFFNSIQAVDAAGQIIATSDKRHLVPFGEYMPYENLLRQLGLKAIADSRGGYSAARERRSVVLPGGLSYLPLICYEIIFPHDVDYVGPRADFIVNVTNDAWYGATPGPYQHLQQAQLRAVELGLPVLRAANNGISAVIDPYGRIVAFLPYNEVGVVDAPLPDKIASIWHNGPNGFVFFTILLALLSGSLIYRQYFY